MFSRFAGVLSCVLAFAAPLAAWPQQSKAAPPQHSIDAAFTYSPALSSAITGHRFWMQGGSAQLHARLYRGFGVVASLDGLHAGNITSSSVGLDLITATVGPRYDLVLKPRNASVFLQALAGGAFASNSIFPSPSGSTTSQNSLALQIGGGLNVPLSRRLALRAVEVNWLRTQLPNSTTNVQNNLVLGAGLVFFLR